MTTRRPSREELEALWLERLRAEWHHANRGKLRGALIPPILTLDTATRRLGSWQSVGRLLSIARAHVERDRWADVVETLRHEMAHQYADEVLHARDEAAHGDAFRHACALLGVHQRGEGGDGGVGVAAAAARDPQTERIVERVQKLLALAASDNQHEAEAAMATAHRLLLQHNLDLRAASEQRQYTRATLGASAASIPLSWKMISGILSQFFFVEAVWTHEFVAARGRDERRLEVFGRPHDVEMARWVHDFLHGALQRLFAAARQRGEVAGNGRRDYEAGVLGAFRTKLRAEREVQAQRGLVWVGDADLGRYMRQEVGPMRSFGATGPQRSAAHAAGQRDGANLRLHRPVSTSGGGGGLLPAPRR